MKPTDLQWQLGLATRDVESAIRNAVSQRVISRLWARDFTIWSPSPVEISNRLGWLGTAQAMRVEVPRLEDFAQTMRCEFTHFVLIGMGGSSLAPELFARVFGPRNGYPGCSIADTTDPDAIAALTERLDLAHTLFVVSTKSGGTVETLSLFKHFHNRVADLLGDEVAGSQFVAITDPGSSLVELAASQRFTATFLADPNIGGRYSALSHFGMVPAALLGVDLRTILGSAIAAGELCRHDGVANPATRLGVALGTLALAGRDKLTFVVSEKLASFGDWCEQLIAESTGKQGKGIVPIVGERLGGPDEYGDDRVFVELRLIGDTSSDAALSRLAKAGHPVIRIDVNELSDVAGQFILWETATAIAGWCLGINPFDQPNVESAKVRAREAVSAYQKSGRLDIGSPSADDGTIAVYDTAPSSSVEAALAAFLSKVRPHDYVGLQAYIPPSAEHDQLLAQWRRQLGTRHHVATTVGYGPRFLHSTGQLHKGDGGHGVFIQVTSDPVHDLPIPDRAGSAESSMSFGVLKMAQALGDLAALNDAGRRAIRLHLKGPLDAGLRKLISLTG
jgi:glucose-6-phosphate isomerase